MLFSRSVANTKTAQRVRAGWGRIGCGRDVARVRQGRNGKKEAERAGSGLTDGLLRPVSPSPSFFVTSTTASCAHSFLLSCLFGDGKVHWLCSKGLWGPVQQWLVGWLVGCPVTFRTECVSLPLIETPLVSGGGRGGRSSKASAFGLLVERLGFYFRIPDPAHRPRPLFVSFVVRRWLADPDVLSAILAVCEMSSPRS